MATIISGKELSLQIRGEIGNETKVFAEKTGVFRWKTFDFSRKTKWTQKGVEIPIFKGYNKRINPHVPYQMTTKDRCLCF